MASHVLDVNLSHLDSKTLKQGNTLRGKGQHWGCKHRVCVLLEKGVNAHAWVDSDDGREKGALEGVDK